MSLSSKTSKMSLSSGAGGFVLVTRRGPDTNLLVHFSVPDENSSLSLKATSKMIWPSEHNGLPFLLVDYWTCPKSTR